MNLSNEQEKSSLNILIFTHSSYLAGAERSLIQLVKELIVDYSTNCTVILPSEGPSEIYLKDIGATTIITSLNWWGTVDELPSEKEIRNRYKNSFESILNNLERFCYTKPDVILTNTLVIPWGALTALLLKLPHVWMVNEFGVLDTNLKFFLPFDQILKIIYDSSDKIVTRSNAIKEELFPNGNSKIKTIYRDIEIPTQKNSEARDNQQYFRFPDSYHLIIAGTIVKQKGQEDAIRSVVELVKNRNRDVELLIVGYSPSEYTKDLQKIIDQENLKERIQILPFQENIFPLLNNADTILVCSRKEAFGRIILEGMLMKKVVIATNSGGTPEMITDFETGFLYSPGDYSKLAEIIENLIDNPELHSSIINNAYHFASKKFTRANYGGEYFKLLMEIKNNYLRNNHEIYAFLLGQYHNLFSQKSKEIKNLLKSIHELEQEIKNYENSISWRITKPLRELKNFVIKMLR